MAKIRRNHPFPKSIYKLFRDNYTPRSREFLRTYAHLANLFGEYYENMLIKAAGGEEEPSKLAERYRSSFNVLLKETKKDPLLYNSIRRNSKLWMRLLSLIDDMMNTFLVNLSLNENADPEEVRRNTVTYLKGQFTSLNKRYLKLLEENYLPMLKLLFDTKGVVIVMKKPNRSVRTGLPFIRVMKPTKREEVLEIASAATREVIENSRRNLDRFEKELEARLINEGFDVKKVYRANQAFFMTTDPVTGNVTFYDALNGKAIGGASKEDAEKDLIEYIRDKDKASKIPDTIWPDGYVEGLPRLNETALSKATGDVIYRSLSDDATSKSITRILPTKKIQINGVDRVVIVSGRFKGYFIDDLVNRAGRMIEGTSHYIDENGKRVSIENVDAEGRPILGMSYQDTGLKENYISVGRNGDLVLGMPTLRKTSKPTLDKALRAVGVDPEKFQPVSKINTKGEFYLAKLSRGKNESAEDYQKRLDNAPQPLSLQQIMGYVKDLESKESLTREEQAALVAFTDYLDFTAEKLKRKRVENLLKTLYPMQPHGKMYPGKKRLNPSTGKLRVIPGTSSTALWNIKPQDFEAVQMILGGVAMSKTASEKVFEYYEDQLRKDHALRAENVENYSTTEIGGFIPEFAGKPFNFNNKQQEGIAWLAVSGYKGVMALDTGVGKTMVSIGSAQNMLKEGYATQPFEDGRMPNGRFLYVCPEALVGNITQDIEKFMTADAGSNLDSRFDQISYKDFAKKRTEDPNWGMDYIAIYFDEAHYLKGSGKLPVAAATLNHPRKIMLTASAIDKDPNDLYQITSITNNIDPKSAEFRAGKRAFVRRFAQPIGGRFVGIKNDPDVKRQFHQWVKANAFFAPKTQVDYTQVGLPALPELSKSSQTVAMDPRVAKEYETVAKRVQKQLRTAIARYRDGEIGAEEIKDFVRNKNLRGDLRLLSVLSIEPEKIIKNAHNPKLTVALDLGKQKIAEGKRILYWTDNNKVAQKNVQKLSTLGGSSRIHVLGLNKSIQFWQDGKKIKSVTSRTKFDKPLGMWAGSDSIRKQIQQLENTFELDEEGRPLKSKANQESLKNIKKLKKELERLAPIEKRIRNRRKTQQRVRTASGNEWAVVALKRFVKSNPLVATVTLTSNYTTGVNLQGFDTVIHLDRNAFSSEAMKQRTARAWRAGAKDPVEEITLDAVVAQDMQTAGVDMSLDQIRELVQEADEKFINEIIATTQETEFSEAYKNMEKENTKSLAVSRKLLEAMLDPTPKNLGRTTRDLADIEKNPVKYVTPRADRFDEVEINLSGRRREDVEELIKDGGFPEGTTLDDIIDLTGFSGSKGVEKITVRPSNTGENFMVVAKGFGGKLQMQRIIRPKSKSIYNSLFKLDKCLPKGIGTRALALQIAAAKKLGIKKIENYSAGEPGGGTYVGYKVWPKFGFNGSVSGYMITQAVRDIPDIIYKIQQQRGYESPRSLMVLDFYLYPESQKWWENNGGAFNGTLDLEGEGFEVFQKYLTKKARQSGDTLEGFIQNAPPPPDYNEDDPDCAPQGRVASINSLVDKYLSKKAQEELEELEGEEPEEGEGAPRLDAEDEEIFAEIFKGMALKLEADYERKELEKQLAEVE